MEIHYAFEVDFTYKSEGSARDLAKFQHRDLCVKVFIKKIKLGRRSCRFRAYIGRFKIAVHHEKKKKKKKKTSIVIEDDDIKHQASIRNDSLGMDL
jgi:hypothetical protein